MCATHNKVKDTSLRGPTGRAGFSGTRPTESADNPIFRNTNTHLSHTRRGSSRHNSRKGDPSKGLKFAGDRKTSSTGFSIFVRVPTLPAHSGFLAKLCSDPSSSTQRRKGRRKTTVRCSNKRRSFARVKRLVTVRSTKRVHTKSSGLGSGRGRLGSTHNSTEGFKGLVLLVDNPRLSALLLSVLATIHVKMALEYSRSTINGTKTSRSHRLGLAGFNFPSSFGNPIQHSHGGCGGLACNSFGLGNGLLTQLSDSAGLGSFSSLTISVPVSTSVPVSSSAVPMPLLTGTTFKSFNKFLGSNGYNATQWVHALPDPPRNTVKLAFHFTARRTRKETKPSFFPSFVFQSTYFSEETTRRENTVRFTKCSKYTTLVFEGLFE